MIRRPPRSTRTDTLFPYTTLFRSRPLRGLRLPAATLELMARLGLRRVEDLYALSPALLTPRFGGLAVRRHAQALGEAAEALSPRPAPPAFLTRQNFAEPDRAADDPELGPEPVRERGGLLVSITLVRAP